MRTGPAALALAALLGSVTAPALADPSSDGSRPQEGQTRPDQRAFVGGAVFFAIAWGLAGAAAASGNYGSDDQYLTLPLLGPWIMAAKGETDAGLILDGVAQVGGAALVGASVLFPERTLGPARADRAGLRLTAAVTRRSVTLGLAF
jgi:hypothetical protein